MTTKDALGWTAADYQALVVAAERLNVPPDWLASIMYAESGMNPAAINPGSGNCGLIQFGREILGPLLFDLTPAQVDNFTKLTPRQQMPYVQKYFKYWQPASGWLSRAQLYQATYVPGTIARKPTDPGTVLVTSKSKIFNPGLSRDGKNITIADLDWRIENKINQKLSKWPVAQQNLAVAMRNVTNIENAVASKDVHPINFVESSLLPIPHATDNAFVSVVGGIVGGLLFVAAAKALITLRETRQLA